MQVRRRHLLLSATFHAFAPGHAVLQASFKRSTRSSVPASAPQDRLLAWHARPIALSEALGMPSAPRLSGLRSAPPRSWNCPSCILVPLLRATPVLVL
jgi:hypothetical protein